VHASARGRHLDPHDGSFVKSLAAVAVRSALTLAAVGAAVGLVAVVGSGNARRVGGEAAVEFGPPSDAPPPDAPPSDAPPSGALPAGALPAGTGPVTGAVPPEAGLPTPAGLAQTTATDGESPGDASTGVAQRPTESAAAPGRPTAQVTVQVLDGAGNPDSLAAAVAALAERGYVVVASNAVRDRVDRTVVLATSGNADEAAALVAADARFGSVGTNQRFAEEVDLHVLVGADWPG